MKRFSMEKGNFFKGERGTIINVCFNVAISNQREY